MMSHGVPAARRLLPENGANLSAARPCLLTGGAHIARAEPSAHGRQTPGPVDAGQGRQPAEPGARSASLDGRRMVRPVCQAILTSPNFRSPAPQHEVSRGATLAIEPRTSAPCERHRSDHSNHLERTKGRHPAHLAGYRAPAAAPRAKPMCRQKDSRSLVIG
jgi:hypothetical protein